MSFRKRKILIVDPDNHVRENLVDIFAHNGFVTVTAVDGKTAVDICTKDFGIDIVIMASDMPVLHGYEATRQIKAFRPKLPIIALTANDDIEFTYVNIGFNSYHKKPFVVKELVQLIKTFLLF